MRNPQDSKATSENYCFVSKARCYLGPKHEDVLCHKHSILSSYLQINGFNYSLTHILQVIFFPKKKKLNSL